jgi:signal transduction histidine kinase
MLSSFKLKSLEIPAARSWAQAWLSAAPSPRPARPLLVALAALFAIGWVDYVAGFWISLQLFYLIPIIITIVWVGWKAGCGIAILSVIVRLVGDIAAGIFEHMAPAAVFWNRLVEICISLIIVWVFHALISLQRELEERVRQRTASLEQAIAARDELQRQLSETGRRERSAIGHDLHDGLGQHLTATSIAANVLSSRLAAAGHADAERARKVVDLVQEGIAITRQIARGLLLSAIEPAELASELEELAKSLSQEHGIECHFTLQGTVAGTDVATASHLFYIAQEAARNALRHGRCKRVEINVVEGEQHLVMTIIDDGIGMAAVPANTPGMGLRIMRHRSELLGGDFAITATEPSGTCVCCRIPMSKYQARSL